MREKRVARDRGTRVAGRVAGRPWPCSLAWPLPRTSRSDHGTAHCAAARSTQHARICGPQAPSLGHACFESMSASSVASCFTLTRVDSRRVFGRRAWLTHHHRCHGVVTSCSGSLARPARRRSPPAPPAAGATADSVVRGSGSSRSAAVGVQLACCGSYGSRGSE
jgi:hypothetical protein